MKKLFLALTLFALPAQAEEVRFCRPLASATAVVMVAEEKGYFKDEGLDVTWQTTTNGKLCQDSLLAGHADFGMVGDGPQTYLGLEAPDHSLRILAQTTVSPELAVFARRDHGIASEADLRGKRIGYLPGTVSWFYLVRLLDRLGLTKNDVTLVPLQPPAMSQALTGGVIDAFVIWDQWGIGAMDALGNTVVRLRQPDLYNYLLLLVGTGDMATNHPQIVQKVLRALLHAEADMKAHPQDTIAYVAKTASTDAARLAAHWQEFDNTIRLDPGIAAMLAADATYVVRDDANFVGKLIPDYGHFVDATALKAVAPDRVTLEK